MRHNINKDTDFSRIESYISKKTVLRGVLSIEHPVRTYGYVKIYGRVAIGCYTFVNERSVLYTGLSLGRYCSVGRNCQLSVFNHPVDWLSSSPAFYNMKVHFPRHIDDVEKQLVLKERPPPAVVGHDVWIGTNAVVARGVNVGTGAIIAGGAFVNRDVPSYAIVGGVPAKVLKYRFNADQIKLLLSSEWWNLPLKVTSKLDFDDIDSVIEQLGRLS